MPKPKPTTVELEQTDLGTLLHKLACLPVPCWRTARQTGRLRNHGLALVGRASMEASPGDPEHRDLAELWSCLDHTASTLDAVKKRLCRDCAMQDVSETVSFGKKPR